jgi:hypothetical protein
MGEMGMMGTAFTIIGAPPCIVEVGKKTGSVNLVCLVYLVGGFRHGFVLLSSSPVFENPSTRILWSTSCQEVVVVRVNCSPFVVVSFLKKIELEDLKLLALLPLANSFLVVKK